jgi:hypothetical protein
MCLMGVVRFRLMAFPMSSLEPPGNTSGDLAVSRTGQAPMRLAGAEPIGVGG